MSYHKVLSTDEKRELKKKLENIFHEMIVALQSFDNQIAPAQHIKDTPKRLAKMYVDELLKGCYTSPPKMTTFDNNESEHVPVIVNDIMVKSICSHHFIPFVGKAVIFYIPGKKLAGLSKFSRIVKYFSRRPQVQEELTKQISHYINDTLEPEIIGVAIKAKHLCMSHRGAEDPDAHMVTYDIILNNKDLGYTYSSIQKILMSNLR